MNIEIKGPAIITLNCDSPGFMALTNNPLLIFGYKNERQSRPGLSFIAYLFTPLLKPLGILIDILHPKSKRNEYGRGDLQPKEDLIAYTALVLVNMLIVLGAYIFYQKSLSIPKTVENSNISTPAFLISLMLIANEMMKIYILSPHTQLLNIAVPIFTCWMAYRAYYTAIFGTRYGYVLALALGMLMLVYANFIVSFAVFISIGAFIHLRKYKFSSWGTFLKQLFLKSLLFGVPTLIWYLTVLKITGSYYVHEIDYYNYGVWIKEYFVRGGILEVLNGYFHNMLDMFKFSAYDFIPTTLLFILTILWAFPEIGKNKDFRKCIKEKVLLTLWISFMFLGLFSSMRYYPVRLCYSLIPLWWPIIGYMANETYHAKTYLFNPKIFSWGIGGVLFIYSIWILVTPWDFRMW